MEIAWRTKKLPSGETAQLATVDGVLFVRLPLGSPLYRIARPEPCGRTQAARAADIRRTFDKMLVNEYATASAMHRDYLVKCGADIAALEGGKKKAAPVPVTQQLRCCEEQPQSPEALARKEAIEEEKVRRRRERAEGRKAWEEAKRIVAALASTRGNGRRKAS